MAARLRNQGAEAHRQIRLMDDRESTGRNASERRCGLENLKLRRSSLQKSGEDSRVKRNLTDALHPFGGVKPTAW
jgi:hypothetical protein